MLCVHEGRVLGISDVRSWALQLWLHLSVVCLFSMLLWQRSTGAGNNIFDLLISVPSLFVLFPLMVYHGWISRRVLLGSLPLLLFVLYAVFSTLWAESPDISKTLRAALQILALYFLFFYCQVSGHSSLLKSALFVACVTVALLCLWHLIVMYLICGMPWGFTLYESVGQEALGQYGVKPINAMHATMMVAPQAALLLGILAGARSIAYRFIGYAALVVLCLFLVALERRTGQLAILAALGGYALVYRSQVWYWLLALGLLTGLVAYWVSPEFFLNRGLSWRPAIWLSTLQSILDAPVFGHGVTNAPAMVEVETVSGGVRWFDHPHNIFLSVAYFTGAVGLILWCLIWVPVTKHAVFADSPVKQERYMVVAMLVGATVLMFDGGNALSPFHFDWFAFWVPALLLVASHVAVDMKSVAARATQL